MFRYWPVKAIIAVSIWICATNPSVAQDSTKTQKPAFIHFSGYYDFPLSFGFTAGADIVLRTTQKTITPRNSTLTYRTRDFILNTDIGFYRYRHNHSGLLLSPSVGFRYIKKSGYYFEMLAGIGVMRTLYDGVVYEVDASGNVKQKRAFGRFYATPQIAATFGWDFSRCAHPKPLAMQLKPIFWIQYPYNSTVLPHLSIELGIKYHFASWYTKVRTHTIIKSRKK